MYTSQSCHDLDSLLVRRDLEGSELERVARHLAECAACRESVTLLDETAVPEVQPGTLIENFRVERTLGEGGTSAVYLATHVEVSRRVAIKVMHRGLLAAAGAKTRFERDAMVIAQLRGEHVCRLSSVGTLESGEPYMVLEYLEGEDLATRLDRTGSMELDGIADVVLQTCTGLAEAHARGIVHRDLKPANLFLSSRPDRSELIKLLDFGAAKLANAEALTRTGASIGSVPYMAPEQLRSSRDVDHRADVWSLGVTIYHLATGRLPFEARSAADTAIRIWTEEPMLLELPAEWRTVVTRCLAKQPTKRFVNVAELAMAIAPFATHGKQRAERVARILVAAR